MARDSGSTSKWAGTAGKGGRAKAKYQAKERKYWKNAAKASSTVPF
ncbi:MAG: hypothetical protein LLG20_01820 [Acidobacteriales bacterium]|nr:hypothetical protein [Terriglobales bacterium]